MPEMENVLLWFMVCSSRSTWDPDILIDVGRRRSDMPSLAKIVSLVLYLSQVISVCKTSCNDATPWQGDAKINSSHTFSRNILPCGCDQELRTAAGRMTLCHVARTPNYTYLILHCTFYTHAQLCSELKCLTSLKEKTLHNIFFEKYVSNNVVADSSNLWTGCCQWVVQDFSTHSKNVQFHLKDEELGL